MQGIIWIIKHSCQKIVNGVCFGCETKLHQKPLDWFRQWFWISLSRYQTASIYNNSFEIRFIVVDLILGIFIIFELPNPQESGNEKHSPIFSSCFFVRAYILVLGKLDVIFDLASIVLHAESIYPPHFGSLHLRFDTHHFRNISWLGYCLHAKPKYYSISKTWTVCMRNNVCYHWLRFWIMTFITNCSPRKWQCDDAEPQTLD